MQKHAHSSRSDQPNAFRVYHLEQADTLYWMRVKNQVDHFSFNPHNNRFGTTCECMAIAENAAMNHDVQGRDKERKDP